MKNVKVAELLYEKNRLYIVYSFNGTQISKTDVTPLWHFFKEFSDYLKEPNEYK